MQAAPAAEIEPTPAGWSQAGMTMARPAARIGLEMGTGGGTLTRGSWTQGTAVVGRAAKTTTVTTTATQATTTTTTAVGAASAVVSCTSPGGCSRPDPGPSGGGRDIRKAPAWNGESHGKTCPSGISAPTNLSVSFFLLYLHHLKTCQYR